MDVEGPKRTEKGPLMLLVDAETGSELCLSQTDECDGTFPLPTWAFARVHTGLRRTPPRDIVRRTRAAIGRTESDVSLCEKMFIKITHQVRDDRIRDVRLSLYENSYENALKVEVAVDRLLDDLEGRPWCT